MWTCESFCCCTKLLSWSTWPLETHVKWENCLFFLKSFDSEDEKLWTQELKWNLSCSSFAKPFYRDIAATIKKDIALFTNTVFMLVFSLWQPTICKMEQGLVTLQQSVECCHNQSDPCSLLSSWINLVMLQLTSCLQEKGLLTVIVFCYLWLVRLFTIYIREFTHVHCMQGEDCCITSARVLVACV